MHEAQAGDVTRISSGIFEDFSEQEFFFDALLMCPAKTLENMSKLNDTVVEFENPIIKTLARPHGGMNEILAIVELQTHLKSKKYDTIVLDTPPGKHFIDFLESCNKIQHFFDKKYLEIFKYLGKPVSVAKDRKFIAMLVSSGIKKLLKYLEKVTGGHFVEDFVDAVVAIYKNKDSFVEAISFEDHLKEESASNWFLVTSVEQQKTKEATALQAKAITLMHNDNFLVINKCLASHLEQWNASSDANMRLKQYFNDREEHVKEFAGANFEKILDFPDILSESPSRHVVDLALKWKEHAVQN